MAVTTDGRAGPISPTIWDRLYDRQTRAVIYQVVLVVAIVALVVLGITNAVENLRRQGIASGFDFLWQRAGFPISIQLIPYDDDVATFGRAFLVGVVNTLVIAGIGVVLATLFGFIVGIGRLSKNWLIAKICAGYVEIVRNCPLLLQLL